VKWPDEFINKVICGDCLEVMESLPAGSIDLIQADPPYNFENLSIYSPSSFLYKTKKQYLKNIEESFGSKFNPEEYLEASIRIMKKYNAYWWCNKDLVPKYINWALKKRFSFNILGWNKLNPVPLKNNNYLPDTEYCIFIREEGVYFNSRLKNLEKYRKFHTTNIGGNNRGEYHPPKKPLFIIKSQIEISSSKSGIILDPFLGSGTTVVACKELERNFIGIEINPDYCKIAEERLAQGVL